MKRECSENYDKRKKCIRDVLDGERKEELYQKMVDGVKESWNKEGKRESASIHSSKLWGSTEGREKVSKRTTLMHQNMSEEKKIERADKIKNSYTEEKRLLHSEKVKLGKLKKKKEQEEQGVKTSQEFASERFTKYNNEVKWTEENRLKKSEENRLNWSDENYKKKLSDKISNTVKQNYTGVKGEELRKQIGEKTKNRPKSQCSFCLKEIQDCRLPGHIKKFHTNEIRKD